MKNEDKQLVTIGPDLDVDTFLAECLAIDPLDLNDAMARFPGQLYYWGNQYSDALQEHLHAEVMVKRVKARLNLILREELTTTETVGAKPGKKGKNGAPDEPAYPGVSKVRLPTVDQVGAAVENHQEYLAAHLAAVEAEAAKARAFGVLDAMRAKREMLVSLGAQHRAEMDFDPVVRQQRVMRREQEKQEAT